MTEDTESLRLEMLDEASLTRQPDEVSRYSQPVTGHVISLGSLWRQAGGSCTITTRTGTEKSVSRSELGYCDVHIITAVLVALKMAFQNCIISNKLQFNCS